MSIYFTSDTHFGHAKIIEYCKRPFNSVEHMNEMLIQNWNQVVKPDDTVYHLGDFAMGSKDKHKGYLDRLNGYKILVRGNHDGKPEKMLAMGFNEVHISLVREFEGKKVYMAHVPVGNDPYHKREYPPEFTPTPPEHDVFLCGHVHEKFARVGNVINVGVDVRGFKPVTFGELL